MSKEKARTKKSKVTVKPKYVLRLTSADVMNLIVAVSLRAEASEENADWDRAKCWRKLLYRVQTAERGKL